MRFSLLMILAVFCMGMAISGQEAHAGKFRNRRVVSNRGQMARMFAPRRVSVRSTVRPFYTDDLGSGSPWGQMRMIGPGMRTVYTDDLESGNTYGRIKLLGPDTSRIYTDDLGSGHNYGAIIVLGAGVEGTEF